MQYILDLSNASDCVYTEDGRAYGMGRVVMGLACEMSTRLGADLGFTSYVNNAECAPYLAKAFPELLPFCLENPPSAPERLTMRGVQRCVSREKGRGYSRSLMSKGYRALWRTYNDRWRHAGRAAGLRQAQQAALVQSEAIFDMDRFIAPRKLLANVYDLITIRENPAATALLRRLANGGAGFLCGSQYVAEDLAEYMPEARGRIEWYHYGCGKSFRPCPDEEYIEHWRSRLNLQKGEPYFVAQTGMQKRKNLEGAVEAVHRLRCETGIPFRLVLAGYSQGVAEYLQITSGKIPWPDFVKFTGSLHDEDFPPVYHGSLALIFLSRAEGFGYPPLEAMACGLPAVASNRTSVPEIIGGSGPVFDPDDLDGVCGELLRLYEDSAYRADRVRKSLAQASRFSWKAAGARVSEIWKRQADK